MDYLIILGNKIKELRQQKGVSQAELAEIAGYSQKGLISRLEAGKVNITMDRLTAIANYFGVPVSDLIHADRKEPDRTLPPGAFHGGVTRPDLIPVVEELKELDSSDVARVKAYIKALRSVKEWQKLNGTAEGGVSGSASMGKSVPSPVLCLDEGDAKKWREERGTPAVSLNSFLSEQPGQDTSKK